MMNYPAAGLRSSSLSTSTNESWVLDVLNVDGWAGPTIDVSNVPEDVLPAVLADILDPDWPSTQPLAAPCTVTAGSTAFSGPWHGNEYEREHENTTAHYSGETVQVAASSSPASLDDDEGFFGQLLEENAQICGAPVRGHLYYSPSPPPAPGSPPTPTSTTPHWSGTTAMTDSSREQRTPSPQPGSDSSFSPASSSSSTPSRYRSGRPRNGWTDFEIDAATAHFLAAHNEGAVGEARFGIASERLKTQGIRRSATAVKTMWNRVGRARSGFDERRKKNTKDKKTGELCAKPLATSQQLRKAEKQKKRNRESSDDEDDEVFWGGNDMSYRAATKRTKR